jgi:hypothetical protein
VKPLILTQDMRVSEHRRLIEEREAFLAQYRAARAGGRHAAANVALGQAQYVTNKLLQMGNVNSRGIPAQ